MTSPGGSDGRDVTALLKAWRAGDDSALEAVMPLVYRELHQIAARHMSGERPGHTLQSTALVNEAFLKLVDQRVDWQNRAHFFAIAANVMRRILVDHARRVQSEKRGSGVPPVVLEESLGIHAQTPSPGDVDVLSLDRALRALEAVDPQQGRVVELRFFGGMTIEETAHVLGVSAPTVKREWAIARAWLLRALEDGATGNALDG